MCSQPKENKKIDIEDDLFIDFEEIDEKEK